MPYCPRCGVEVEDRLEACPLCDTPIPKEVRQDPPAPADYPKDVIPPKPLYRKLTEGQKHFLIASLIAFLGLFPIAITLGIDLLNNSSVTWSYYVMVPLIGGGVVAWLFYRYGKRPLISVSAMLLIILMVQMLIGYRLRPDDFFRSPEIPYFLVSFAAVEIFLIFIARKRPGVLQLLAFIFFDAALLVGAINLLVSRQLTWALVVISALLPVSAYLIYLRKVKRKGLNIVGFLFVVLTIMLLAIDWTISGGFSWSLVTSLIFLAIAAVFYILHIGLFNDTDWKKALHL
jgi:hypothetical protein